VKLRDFVVVAVDFTENITIAALIYKIPLVANKTPKIRNKQKFRCIRDKKIF
jgi:hypothetical protein